MPEWQWGEVYIWGGVTWTPAPPLSREDQLKVDEEFAEVTARAALSDAAPSVWMAVKEQYRVAAHAGDFAGIPLSPVLAATRFGRLVRLLDVPVQDALSLVRTDATPLLVDPEGVQSAFELLVGVSSREKALEIVRRHPGVLVGGVQSLKDGASPVTKALVNVLLAGRLKGVLEDQQRDDTWKLREVEFYTWTASIFKPVMDLIQRRTKDLSWLFAVPVLPAILRLASTVTLRDIGLDAHMDELTWLAGLVSFILAFGGWGTGAGSYALVMCAWVLQAGSWALSTCSWALGSCAPLLPEAAASLWVLWLGAWVLGLGSRALSAESWLLSWLPEASVP